MNILLSETIQLDIVTKLNLYKIIDTVKNSNITLISLIYLNIAN
jgi:hypothetical protein